MGENSTLPRNTKISLEKEIAFGRDIEFEDVLGKQNKYVRYTHVVT